MTCHECEKYGTICCGTLKLTPCKDFKESTYPRSIVTNRDRIDALTDEELTKFMIYDLPCIKADMTNSEIGLLQWLQAPYDWESFRVSRHKDYSRIINQLNDES